jgi:cobalt-zinc-cadmium efflux system protein
MAPAAHPHAPHAHHHAGPVGAARYGAAILLNVAIVLMQVVVGLAVGSAALLADAGHNAGDVAGLLLAGLAALAASRPGGVRRTFGWGKAGVLAALANAVLLLAASALLLVEAGSKLLAAAPAPPGGPVMVAAAVALVANIGSALLLRGGGAADINRRAAVTHLLADAGVSAAVLVAGALILVTGAWWVDPVATILVVAVILRSAVGLFRRSLDLALDAAPAHVDVEAVRHWLLALPGVTAVHDLHIWPMSATETAVTAHLVVPAGGDDALLATAVAGLGARFGLHHVTLQVERSDLAPGGCEAGTPPCDAPGSLS